METYIKKQTPRTILNKLLRVTQRVDVTKLSTKTVTVRNVYKNKQIIEVSSESYNRFNLKM